MPEKTYFGLNFHELLLLSPCVICYSLLLIKHGQMNLAYRYWTIKIHIENTR